jgi:hypothetical protein
LLAPARTVLVGLAVTMALLAPAAAETAVRGRADDMQIQAENASIREVLDALAGDFKVRYRLPAHVSRIVTGRYSGTLHQVLGRILDGHDYIVEATDDAVRVVVLGASGTAGVASAAVTAAGAPGLASVTARPVPRPPTATSADKVEPYLRPAEPVMPLASYR